MPAWLRPSRSGFLVRLGRDYDGGYLVDRRDVEAADGLVSLGVNRDWSFEEGFVAINDVPLVAYDAAIDERILLKDIAKSILRRSSPAQVAQAVRVVRNYRTFFRGNRRHVQQYVGLDWPPAFVEMGPVLDGFAASGCRRPFVKIDIEGAEYRLLGDLIERAGTMTGLAIEFHDCDIHLARIRDFVERFGLHLVHVHVNNYAPLGKGGLPLVIEMTFSSSPPAGGEVGLPDPLDMPCMASAPDYAPVFVEGG